MRFNLLILLLFAITAPAFAQRSPAWDPNVYLPHLGVPGEFDTVHVANGQLQQIYNIGPEPGGSYGRIAITGLPSNPPFISVVEAGHSFDLHQLNIIRKLDIAPGNTQRLVHLRSRAISDLVVDQDGDGDYRIYWQGDDGLYDTARMTRLESGFSDLGFANNICLGRFVSDSTSDIVALASNVFVGSDTMYLLLWNGRTLADKGAAALPDSVLTLPPVGGRKPYMVQRYFTSGDWRGVGREDVIASTHVPGLSSWLYFRNDPPFSMQRFADAILYDTIFTPWENRNFRGKGTEVDNALSFQALPHAAWDHAVDFAPSLPEDGLRNGSIYFFRGGPDFGTHRLYMDSAEAVIVNPAALDPAFEGLQFWGRYLNAGDMTGTGRPVIITGGGIFTTGYDFYYVLGNAIDGLADVFYSFEHAEIQDSLTADADGLEDQIIGSPYDSRLSILHGSKRIPVRINPRYGVKAESVAEGVDVFPNPADRQFAVTMHSRGGSGVCIVRNLLGQEVFRVPLQLLEGEAGYRVQLPHLPSGEYMITIEATESSHHAKLTIVH